MMIIVTIMIIVFFKITMGIKQWTILVVTFTGHGFQF